MTATKYTMTITIQVLDMNVVPGLLTEAADSINRETLEGC